MKPFRAAPKGCCIVLILLSIGFGACRNQNGHSPHGYDMNKPKVMNLGKILVEISGLAYTPENIVTISDNKEKIFGINLKTKKLTDLKDHVVPPDSDLEDVVVSDSAYYLLSSSGVLKKVPLQAEDSSQTSSYDLGLKGQNDFETLYYDPTANGLVLICKSCAEERGKKIRTAYRFDLTIMRFDTSAFFHISRTEVEDILKDADARLDPSAAAINPLDKRLYIISSASNLLVIADTRGKVMEAYRLNPDLYPQPEGITFAPNGDMYISNEGKYGKPTLLHIPFHESSQKKK
jgi:uncharacterized protein YjiK